MQQIEPYLLLKGSLVLTVNPILSPSSREPLVKFATYAALLVSIFLVLSKGLAWYLTNSLSVKASLIDSLLDSFASLINFFAVRHALRPPDAQYRFGHGKAEALASLAQSVFIALSSLWLMKEVVERIYNPVAMAYNAIAIAVMVVSTLLTVLLVMGQQYVAKRTNSLAIAADALHYKTDVLTNLGVLLSFVISAYFNFIYFDALVGAGISLYIFKTSWQLVKKSFDVLMDRELPKDTLTLIRQTAQNHPQVLGIHDLRTRSSGHNDFIQMHLDLDASLTLVQAHEIADEVADQLYKLFPSAQVIIHQDPVGQYAKRQHVLKS